MPNYRRVFEDGYSYFITVTTYNRKPILIQNINILRESFYLSKQKYDYKIEAIVILPDHFHTIITPAYAKEYPKIISHIKRSFLFLLDPKQKEIAKNALPLSKQKRKQSGIWQNRYYEHTIRDEKDFKIRFDYIHFNPVKHGLVSRVKDWQFSSFFKYVKKGWYHMDWGDFEGEIDFE